MEGDKESVTIRVSKGWLILFALLLLGPWLILALVTRDRVGPDPDGERSIQSGTLRQVVSRPGPWGDLRVVRIITEPPAEAIADGLTYSQPVWLLRSFSATAFEDLLRLAGLTSAQQEIIRSVSERLPEEEGFVVRPSDQFVLDLSAGSRAVLYGALSQFRENVFQREPFRFRADLVEDWFVNSGVSESAIALVKRLTYRRGRAVLFSDPHLVLPRLSSDLERVRLMKTLCRQSTLMVHLRVSPESDIESLLAYWAASKGLAKDIAPLLESASRLPGGCEIDIAHFLPRFARKRIFTYPSREANDGEVLFDCHWTSLNFWNDPPDNRFNDPEFVLRTLTSDYELVLDRFSFGDVILFMESEREAVHSAVYIADDIVFTKNGPSPRSPWILMPLDTLMAHYEGSLGITIRGFRRKAGG